MIHLIFMKLCIQTKHVLNIFSKSNISFLQTKKMLNNFIKKNLLKVRLKTIVNTLTNINKYENGMFLP